METNLFVGGDTLLLIKKSDLIEFGNSCSERAALRALEEFTTNKIETELLTQREVCKLCKVTRQTIGNWERSGFIARRMTGNDTRPRYLKSEILNAFNVNK